VLPKADLELAGRDTQSGEQGTIKMACLGTQQSNVSSAEHAREARPETGRQQPGHWQQCQQDKTVEKIPESNRAQSRPLCLSLPAVSTAISGPEL
jgi:hypothetical protein